MSAALTSDVAIGERHGRLVVQCRVANVGHEGRWLCVCDCGGSRTIAVSRLRTGSTKGMCRHCERLDTCASYRKYSTKVSETPVYRIWIGIRSRCSNQNDAHFAEYGGRGIAVCERWSKSFAAFDSDMGPRPSPGHSVGRINNDLAYEPANCRWETALQQANNRRNNHRIAALGRTLTVTEWAKVAGIPRSTLTSRLRAARRRNLDERLRLCEMILADLGARP